MAITQTLTTPPTPPSSSDVSSFKARADAFVSWIVTFVTEIGTFTTQANALESNVNALEQSAQQSAELAVAMSNFLGIWSSSTAYVVGDSVVYNGVSYRSIQAGTNQQPDTATTYWARALPLADSDTAGVFTIRYDSGSQTLFIRTDGANA